MIFEFEEGSFRLCEDCLLIVVRLPVDEPIVRLQYITVALQSDVPRDLLLFGGRGRCVEILLGRRRNERTGPRASLDGLLSEEGFTFCKTLFTVVCPTQEVIAVVYVHARLTNRVTLIIRGELFTRMTGCVGSMGRVSHI
jgi:hypothetical protein